jgi:hydrogenase maturation protease
LKEAAKPLLVLGYGNPSRGDDGLGPRLVETLEEAAIAGVDFEVGFQLAIEDAATMSEYGRVLFVDADVSGPAPFRAVPIGPSETLEFTSHDVSAQTVLAICEESFGASPAAWMLAVRGYEFGFSEELSAGAEENLRVATAFARTLIELVSEEKSMSGSGKKTVLIIDDDPDIRSSMRIVLEAAGFSVGESATGEEGMKTAERIQPDAVIVDLMMETVDAGSKLSQQLKSEGYKGPIYLLSSAGDAVRFNLDARELGLAGIFQKPIDHAVLIDTLKKKLKV